MNKTYVEISSNALLHNYRQISKILKPNVKLMAVLKSNAYGHGLAEVAKLLLQNPKPKTQNPKSRLWFGVDSADEAIYLNKNIGHESPILILGYVPESALDKLPKNVRLTVYNFETIKSLKKINKKFKVHIKVETGTQRQGIAVGDIPDFIKKLKKTKNIKIEGISSHLAQAEDIFSSTFTGKQYKIFYDASKLAEKLTGKKLLKHIACSAAISHLPKSHFDMVRAGINLYGLQSINTRALERQSTRARLLNLKPVLSWKTVVAQVKNVSKGAPVGYGRTEKMPYAGQIAILPVGYWDGYDRRLGSMNNNNSRAALFAKRLPAEDPCSLGRGQVLIGGKRCKIFGCVCMNMCMAFLPKDLKVKAADEVILIGGQGKEEITVDELAHKMGTINYEVVTRINPLIPRLVV